MCRTFFTVMMPGGQAEFGFFAQLPARPVQGDAVMVWPLLPVELAADPAHDWLQSAGVLHVRATLWGRDAQGIYLTALLFREER